MRRAALLVALALVAPGELAYARPPSAAILLESTLRIVVPSGVGTGFLVGKDGGFFTAAHLVTGATEIFAELPDRTRRAARIVAVDPAFDVAYGRLEVPTTGRPLPLASGLPNLGDPAVATGHPLGRPVTVARGVITALHRSERDVVPPPGLPLDEPLGAPLAWDLVEIDLPSDQGCSGGPVSDGTSVIGMIMMTRRAGTRATLAVPSAILRLLHGRVPGGIRNGRFVRGWIGLALRADTAGAIVTAIAAGSPAAKAGIRVGDQLPATSAAALLAEVAAAGPGVRHTLRVSRSGAALPVEVIATEPPIGAVPAR
jgi:S1-C subfamily serine protease